MSEAPSKTLREGSREKRGAILKAARALFLTGGFDRSSVDAVAARAGVSKRTVYDYFGDKRTLLLAVVDQARDSLMLSIQRAIDDNLTDVVDLEQALVSFATRVATSTVGSSDYVALMRLTSVESAQLADFPDHGQDSAPEQALAVQLAQFGRDGLLEVPNPRVAAEHFVALTLLLVLSNTNQNNPGLNNPSRASDTNDARDQTITEGVRAFLRAYRPSPR